MCELFAMSSRKASPTSYALHEFATHGGKRFRNKDGWGIALYQERDAYLFKEPMPASDSALVRLVEREQIPTRQLIAHIRLASVGLPRLENTHPFQRTLDGNVHCFAHNGGLSNFVDTDANPKIVKQMLGETDSEYIFCALLSRIRKKPARASKPDLERRFEVFSAFAREMAQYGMANFLYSDGEALFVHAHQRRHETKNGVSEPKPPGLYIWSPASLTDSFHWKVRGARIEDIDPQTVLVASVPLDDRDWEPLPEGTALVIKDGIILLRETTC
jgi:predicted glutamine amidotransferase